MGIKINQISKFKNANPSHRSSSKTLKENKELDKSEGQKSWENLRNSYEDLKANEENEKFSRKESKESLLFKKNEKKSVISVGSVRRKSTSKKEKNFEADDTNKFSESKISKSEYSKNCDKESKKSGFKLTLKDADAPPMSIKDREEERSIKMKDAQNRFLSGNDIIEDMKNNSNKTQFAKKLSNEDKVKLNLLDSSEKGYRELLDKN